MVDFPDSQSLDFRKVEPDAVEIPILLDPYGERVCHPDELERKSKLESQPSCCCV
jgi:hypothetical protein